MLRPMQLPGVEQLALRGQGSLSPVVFLAVAMLPSFGGCHSTGRDKPGVDGYWKGQMIEDVALTGHGASPPYAANERPRRILLKLEESAGLVQGRFAQSSDLIAFRQIDNKIHVVSPPLRSRESSMLPGSASGSQPRQVVPLSLRSWRIRASCRHPLRRRLICC